MTPYYDDGTCVIYHGDALEIIPRLPQCDGVITDPPYMIGAVSAGTIGSKAGMWADMMNSALWFGTWYRMVASRLTHAGGMWTFCNWRSLPVVMRAAADADLPVTSMAVWDKQWIGPGGHQGLRPSYELVALIAKPDFAIPDRGIADIIRCQVGSYKPHGHPAEKPERLVHQLIQISGWASSSLLLDPFLGSGTTAAAAKAAGMRCIGIEAEERYCEMAASRLTQEILPLGVA